MSTTTATPVPAPSLTSIANRIDALNKDALNIGNRLRSIADFIEGEEPTSEKKGMVDSGGSGLIRSISNDLDLLDNTISWSKGQLTRIEIQMGDVSPTKTE